MLKGKIVSAKDSTTTEAAKPANAETTKDGKSTGDAKKEKSAITSEKPGKTIS